ncbi:MAG: hypothetical protein COT85_02140 [Chlamydiae bacterium CG10_big_fil_rev_8_21_14_0_10_42_34]|nr:MAG: hypothetical protein COT85_02140 [Chlamydiae bacterium CG10_big_fil_rev_8_21_14_0_10_42_34]
MKLLSATICLLLISPMLLLAEGENRAVVGSRPMSEEAAKQVNAAKPPAANEDESFESQTAGYIHDQYPPIYYSNSHHWLASISINDSDQYELELEDGSVWKINSYDGSKALNWRSNDPLTITQNNRWFSRHTYRIINKSNGTSAEANLFLGPILRGEFSRFIANIDHSKREISLNDNTYWEISYLDTAVFSDWDVNDYIIIGTNSNVSFWDSGSDVLLINVNMNNSVRAKQF